MKRVMNLYDALMEASGDVQNPELTNWAKSVRQVDLNERNGWMYIGDFVRTGTMEVEIAPTVYIVLSTSGTWDQPFPVYRVVLMDEEGELTATNICTDGLAGGWALRLRDQIVDLLMFMEMQAAALRAQYDNVLPVETVDFLEQEARQALERGDDVPVYPETLLALIHHYRERMRL